MKTLHMKKGARGGWTKNYYITLADDLCFESDPMMILGPTDYKIILECDAGCYPGTPGQVAQNEFDFIIDELRDMGIIEKGKYGFSRGPNY